MKRDTPAKKEKPKGKKEEKQITSNQIINDESFCVWEREKDRKGIVRIELFISYSPAVAGQAIVHT